MNGNVYNLLCVSAPGMLLKLLIVLNAWHVSKITRKGRYCSCFHTLFLYLSDGINDFIFVTSGTIHIIFGELSLPTFLLPI